MLGTLSVREVCEFELLQDTKVLAGASGLERPVQRLNVMTVPDIAQWTKPHEFLLATGFPLSQGSVDMVPLLEELDQRGVAALGVKLGDYGAVLDEAALQTADRLGLPIISVPEDAAFDDILSEVLAALTNRQAAALGRAQEVHHALLRISLGGGGLDDIVQRLSSVLGGIGVVCANTAGEILAERMSDAQWRRLHQDGIVDASGAFNMPAALADDQERAGSSSLVAQISAGELRHGYLLAVSEEGPLDQEVEMMVQQAAMVAALNISKDLAVTAVARRFEGSAIHGLLAGTARDIEEVARRSAAFEWNLDRPLVVLAARRERGQALAEDPMAREHDIGAWVFAVRAVDRHAAAGLLGRNLVAVCGAADRPETMAARVSDQLTGSTRTRFHIGASGIVDEVTSLPRGYEHARMALEYTQRSGGAASVTSYENLGLFRLLNAVPDRRELATFVDETIGPVLELPTDEREDMLSTLDVLLSTRMNVAESSRRLHYHYNTMRYRIRKLEHLLGDFSEDSQLELRITVALHIVKMWRMTD